MRSWETSAGSTPRCASPAAVDDIRYQYPLAGGALMDAGCYAVHCARLLGPGEPTVVGAHARTLGRDSRVDRAMTVDLRYPTGASGQVVTSMWSSALLRIRARVIGTRGELTVTNFAAPHLFHRLKVTVAARPGASGSRATPPTRASCGPSRTRCAATLGQPHPAVRLGGHDDHHRRRLRGRRPAPALTGRGLAAEMKTLTVSGMRALIVRGGAEFHEPVKTTDSFVPFLRSRLTVDISEDLDVYLDEERLARTDLILQCWTGGDLTAAQSAGLRAAVTAGTGFGGWHGGVVAAFPDRGYQWMTGGWFVCHPGDFIEHELVVVSDHPIVAGIDRVALNTERYWVLADAGSDVHATITFPVEKGEPGTGPSPIRLYGPAPGARAASSSPPSGTTCPTWTSRRSATITERGLLWAPRRP